MRRKLHPKSIFRKVWEIPKTFTTQFITRDIDISRNEFLAVSFLFSTVVVLIINLTYSFWGGYSPKNFPIDWKFIYIIAIITLVVTGLSAGVIIDSQKSKIKWTFGILVLSSACFLFTNTAVGDFISYAFGIILNCFTALFLFIEVISTLLVKTSIMERARVTAAVLFIVGISALVTIAFVNILKLYDFLFLLFFILLGCSAFFAQKTDWKAGNEKFNGRISRELLKQGILQYAFFFFFFSFLLGVSVDTVQVDYGFMGLMMFPWAIGSAILLDNVGRKGTIILTVLIMAIFIVFSGSSISYDPKLLSGLFGVVLVALVILIVVLSGDLASPGIRGRVISVNGMALVGGFLLGLFTRYNMFGQLTPNDLLVLNDATSFALILLIMLLIPLKDTLTNRDIPYRDRILQIYVNNFNGINLYVRDITEKITLDEDLVSGGLTGIAAMVGEITQSEDKPSVIDSGDRTIMLEYGQYVVLALVVKKRLYILRQKMKAFIKDFEETFAPELQKDTGNVGPFGSAKYLVQKYFKID